VQEEQSHLPSGADALDGGNPERQGRNGGIGGGSGTPREHGEAVPTNLDIYAKSVCEGHVDRSIISHHERKKRRVFHRAISGIKKAQFKNEQLRFLTLTSKYTEESDFQHAWRKFVWRIRRKFKKFEYLMIREKTQSGLIHAHVIFRGYFVPHEWIVETWKELTGFEIINIQLLMGHPAAVAGYVAKYVSKEHLHYGWSKYWVFPYYANVWQRVKKFTGYNIPLSIEIFDKILMSGWVDWKDRKLFKKIIESGDYITRQKEL
jgi:hypothetical protein